ncbi:phosphorothioated DNA-binding restriction endonuclease [Actinocorallia sp. B10E7]|uniref:phosphorothioated DNA-binding restriction endonuclease n=1 Tax=Actinocorallia sp. B10E7 TaxID=3153558 RepID=UPI00325F86C9
MSFVERALAVRRWQSNGKRAPHKPLLLLFALAQFQREGDTPIVYSAVESRLAALVKEFGPPNPTGLHYPFHHLTSDGLWTVTTRDGGPSPGPSPAKLRDSGARGCFAPDVADELRRHPEVLVQAAHALLDANFPESLHEDLCEAIGLDLHQADSPRLRQAPLRRRDPGFRRAVLRAYEYTCAFCGYEGRLDDSSTVGLDAAHIRWFAFDGPDVVDNGLCLCSLHHVLFDKGVLTLTEDHRIDVTEAFVGRTPNTRVQVHSLAGRRIDAPRQGLAAAHLSWHRTQVFRGSGTAA